MRKGPVALPFALAILASASVALAQKGAGVKPAQKPEPAAAPAPPPAATPPPAPTPPAPEPAATIPPADPKAVGVGLDKSDQPEPKDKGTSSDVTEKPGQTYYFIGLRYGGTVIPKFMLNIFVKEGATIFSHSVGAEIDIRKDGFSMIPSLSYTEYGTGDVLFLEKNKDDKIAGNWSMVNSSMKALYLSADLLWSAPISKNVEFEYGAGFGLGIIFGDLVTNWVRFDPNGKLTSSDGRKFSPCQVAGEGGGGSGCNITDHTNASVAKVGGYAEPSWANGGSKPNLFPRILLHLAGVRIKPVKQFAGRLGLGFSITEGFWFGFSGNYGLERPEKKSGTTSSSGPVLRWQ